MLDFYSDEEIKFEYAPETNKFAFKLNHIGAHDTDSIAVTTLTHTDANTIFVNGSSGSDSNAGTEASPKVTILASINATTADKIYVVVLNSQHFAEDLSTATTTYFTGLFADTAITATLSTRITPTFEDANTIYFGATSGTAGGDGSLGDEVNTIALAVGLCDGTHQRICEIDGDTYEEPGIEFTGDFQGMYALEGKKPTFKPTLNVDLVNTPSAPAVPATPFETGALDANSDIDTVKLNNGNWVCCYTDDGDSDKGKFVIYSENGTLVKADTFEQHVVSKLSVSILNNGNWVCCYSHYDNPDHVGKFVIYSASGVKQEGATEFLSSQLFYPAVSVLTDDSWVCCFKDGLAGKFVIYNEAGTVEVKGVTTFETNDVAFVHVAGLNNGNWVCCYWDNDDGDSNFIIYDSVGSSPPEVTKTAMAGIFYLDDLLLLNDTNWIVCDNQDFRIYDEDGGVVKTQTAFATSSQDTSISQLPTNGLTITYIDNNDADKGKLLVLSEDGATTIHSARTIESDVLRIISTVTLDNGNIVICCDNTTDDDGQFIIETPYIYSGVKISDTTMLNGFILDSNDLIYQNKLIEINSAKPTIQWCDLKNCTNGNVGSNLNGFSMNGDDDIDLSNCQVFDNDDGLYTASNDCEINDCQFYRNAAGKAIEIEGAGSGIVVEHTDIFNNNAGIYLNTNDGDEVLKNNIIHNNDNLGIEATTSVGYTYTLNTDSVDGATSGASVILANPLYLNEGAIIPASIDLHIKTTVEGYPSDSPAKDLADDTRNAGSYDVRYIGAATSWTSITVDKDRRHPIKVWYEAVSGSKNVGQDGTVEYSKKGQTENVEIHWAGLLQADFVKILAMWSSDKNEVRLYPQPTTSPNAYNTYTMERPKLNASADNNKLTEIGKSDITIKLSRKYEDA